MSGNMLIEIQKCLQTLFYIWLRFRHHREGPGVAGIGKVDVDRPVQLGTEGLGDAAAEPFQPRHRHASAERNVLQLIERPILALDGDDLDIGREVEAGEENRCDFGGCFNVAVHTGDEYLRG